MKQERKKHNSQISMDQLFEDYIQDAMGGEEDYEFFNTRHTLGLENARFDEIITEGYAYNHDTGKFDGDKVNGNEYALIPVVEPIEKLKEDGQIFFTRMKTHFGLPFSRHGKHEKGGMVDGFDLEYERWVKPMDGIAGTIRVTPQNYWVATVMTNGKVKFDSWEGR